MDEGAAEVRALQHPARQLPGIMAGEFIEPDIGQQGMHPVTILRLALGAVVGAEGPHDLQRQHDVPLDGEPGQHGRILEGHADAQGLGRHLAPADENGPPGRLQQARRQPQDRRPRSPTGRPERRIRHRQSEDSFPAGLRPPCPACRTRRRPGTARRRWKSGHAGWLGMGTCGAPRDGLMNCMQQVRQRPERAALHAKSDGLLAAEVCTITVCA